MLLKINLRRMLAPQKFGKKFCTFGNVVTENYVRGCQKMYFKMVLEFAICPSLMYGMSKI